MSESRLTKLTSLTDTDAYFETPEGHIKIVITAREHLDMGSPDSILVVYDEDS